MSLCELLLELAHESLLLVHGLEAAMAELGARVDELESDLLESTAARLGHNALYIHQPG